MSKNLAITFLMLIIINSIARSVHALDFFGAQITDRDTPSSYMKMGIVGLRPTVIDLKYDSPANECGFNVGDIIFSINDKDIRKTSEINQFTTDSLSLLVISGGIRKTLTIDRRAVLEEINKQQIEKQRQAINNNQSRRENYQQEDLPTIRFDDNALEKKFGKSTPMDRERERQRAEIENKRFQYEQDEKNKLIIIEQLKRVEAEQARQQKEMTEQFKRQWEQQQMYQPQKRVQADQQAVMEEQSDQLRRMRSDMTIQQGEMQRQQDEMNRMRQQQQFNKIWR